ncbi:MAG TPA: LL-diaminopimelate aminotransferase [Candidatus Sumerlaeota bacterium]|nr:MAG: LL-diaminopimelate aminotransferase [candidate division BRC1 bacterium ADurb.Bin183]HOE63637.1 LL-diaminopimelate aminotransferase [Candidatus Sumerlaeota bacterium]HRR30855.1 LL-diaminopimelate aminotransferase [Candidatus Sumerlaeia bacterium]HON50533.1 LL-diaminopimelate aminotransferase [Candidatus Sumerlaeota bacterium]HOR63748.1 LL-diaminopimelate aminotransferase [Candidatus Sumerlaeota bacterium]
MEIKAAERLNQFPVYLFDKLDADKAAVQARGVDVISLGQGDPDEGTPPDIVEELARTARDSKNHHYPSFKGLPEYLQTIAVFYKNFFNVSLEPGPEILSLIGSKSGVGRLPLAVVNPGEAILCPDPCYPAYIPGMILAGAQIDYMPLLEKNGFLPDLTKIPETTARKAKLMILNYPNNPTSAVATVDFLKEVVEFAKKYEIIVAYDAPYNMMLYGNEKPISFLQIPGAKDVGVEFHSMSKLFNMTGWRCAFVSGNRHVISALSTMISNTDMGIFRPIQYAAIKALKNGTTFIDKMNALYLERRNVIVNGLRELGWKVEPPKGTFFVWLPVPESGKESIPFALELLQKTGVLITPGRGFGEYGEGYLRIALTVSAERLREVVQRIKAAGYVYK